MKKGIYPGGEIPNEYYPILGYNIFIVMSSQVIYDDTVCTDLRLQFTQLYKQSCELLS